MKNGDDVQSKFLKIEKIVFYAQIFCFIEVLLWKDSIVHQMSDPHHAMQS